jgi:hypothetical protein
MEHVAGVFMEAIITKRKSSILFEILVDVHLNWVVYLMMKILA